MRTRAVPRARGGLRAAAIGLFISGLLGLFLPNATASSCWGRLASSGYDGEPIRTTLFFAGQANDGSTPYGCFIGPNVDTYTLHPAPRDLHLNWTNAANREVVMDLTVNAKINVISMSSWGEEFLPCADGWVTGAAPIQTSPQAHDELFSAAVNKLLLIVPFIESRSTWSMRDEFPVWPDGRVSPGLVSQIVNLIQRYLQNPDHPEWSNVWAKVYDYNGTARHAVVLIHAASNNLSPLDHGEFAAGLVDDCGRAGLVYNSWNGFTEGTVGTTTVERGNSFYNWLTALNFNEVLHVDRNFTGSGKGTLSEPFPTVATAITEACEGEVIRIGRGSYPESLTISKRLRLEAGNGSVTVGAF